MPETPDGTDLCPVAVPGQGSDDDYQGCDCLKRHQRRHYRQKDRHHSPLGHYLVVLEQKRLCGSDFPNPALYY